MRSTEYVMDIDKIPHDAAEDIAALNELILKNPNDEDALIRRGRIYWGLGLRSEAINDYLAAQRINPNGKGKELLKATYEILNFYNKDLYNP